MKILTCLAGQPTGQRRVILTSLPACQPADVKLHRPVYYLHLAIYNVHCFTSKLNHLAWLTLVEYGCKKTYHISSFVEKLI